MSCIERAAAATPPRQRHGATRSASRRGRTCSRLAIPVAPEMRSPCAWAVHLRGGLSGFRKCRPGAGCGRFHRPAQELAEEPVRAVLPPQCVSPGRGVVKRCGNVFCVGARPSPAAQRTPSVGRRPAVAAFLPDTDRRARRFAPAGNFGTMRGRRQAPRGKNQKKAAQRMAAVTAHGSLSAPGPGPAAFPVGRPRRTVAARARPAGWPVRCHRGEEQPAASRQQACPGHHVRETPPARRLPQRAQPLAGQATAGRGGCRGRRAGCCLRGGERLFRWPGRRLREGAPLMQGERPGKASRRMMEERRVRRGE
jgi:hypothetical protein